MLAGVALGFLVITLRTQRLIEHLAPFAVFALALSWRPHRSSRLAPVLIALGAVWIALFARHPIDLLRERSPTFSDQVAAALQQIVPEGEQIVSCEWHSTGEMMLALPARRFMVALDPVFFAMHDADA